MAGADCPISGCENLRLSNTVMCPDHLALLSRSLTCALRRAWRAGDARTVRNVSILAVREVEWRLDMLAAQRG